MWRRRPLVVVVVLVAALLGVPAGAHAALAAPPNDNFANAQPIGGTAGSVDGTLGGATTEPGEPSGTLPSIWYRWTAPASGLFRFDVTTGVFVPDLTVYTGSSLATLQDAPADWCPPKSYDHTAYVLTATAGASYLFSLNGYAATADTGRTILRWAPYTRPANDTFAAATVVTGLAPVLDGDNCAASAEPGEPLDQYTSRRTVWFSWTPDVTMAEILPQVAQHLIVTVYSGSTVGALTKVARSAYVHGEYGSDFQARAGTTYHIQVDSQGNPPYGIVGPQPPFHIALSKYPHCNDAFSCAAGMASDIPLKLSGTELTDNIGATAETGEPAHAGNPASHSLWWRLTPPVGATVTISTAGSAFDTVLAVYTGTAVGALTPVAADDDAAGGGASRLSLAVTGGRSYLIAVDGKAGATGQLNLAWRLDIPAPANDMFAAATVISGAQGTSTSYTWSATKEAGEPAHEGAGLGQSVWWRYTAPTAGRLHLVSSGDYTVMTVYQGSAVNGLTRVTGARWANNPITLDIDAVAGATYAIVVDVTDPVYGPDVATLTWTLFPPRPANDYIADATPISGASGGIDGSDVGATTTEPDEPYGTSVFYRWTAPAGGLYVFDTLTSDFDTQLWIYRGWAPSLSQVTRVTWNDDAVDLRSNPDDYAGVVGAGHTSAAGFAAVAGQVYTILLAGPEQMQGRFRLNWAPVNSWRPANDAFSAAQPLTGGSGSVTARISDSTVEPGEPGDAYGSVWYTWTAPSSGPIRFWTGPADGAAYPLLSVYTGSTLSGLTLLGENGYGVSTNGSRLDLTVTAGTSYRIRLAGWDGTSVYWPGTSVLNWGPPPPAPANDAFAAATAIGGSTGGIDGNSQWSTREPGEPAIGGDPVGSVWYRWTAPASGSASFWITQGNLYPAVAVFTGSRVDALAQAEKAPPNDERVDPGVRTTIRAVAGTVYAIQVQGSDYINGSFHLQWSMSRPPNDDLASAVQLTGREGVSPAYDWSATTIRATAEAAEPRHDPSRDPAATVWYRWTAPGTGPVTFEDGPTTFPHMLAMYTGSGYGSLTQVTRTGWDSFQTMTFDAVAGRTYLIVADTGPLAGETIRLRWSQYTDHVKPSGTVVIDGGAAATGQRMVTLTLAGADDVGVSYVRLSNSPMLDSATNPGGTQPILMYAEQLDGNPATVRWSLTDLYRGGSNADGVKTVYAQWCDAQGNCSAVASDTIVADLTVVPDTAPPTGSVTINGGATYTSTTGVSLALPASDLGSGVAQVRLSNRPDSSNGRLVYGVTREWAATAQPWSLADPAAGGSTTNGTRTVYAQFRDGAGNWSKLYSDTIVLDTAAPSAKAPTAIPSIGSSVTTGVPGRLTWSATDTTSGVAMYELHQSIDGGIWARIALPTPLTTSVVRTLVPGHTYRFRIRAADRAGLWSGWQTGPVLTPGIYQETSATLTWSGTWTRAAVSGSSGGYVRYSTAAGARTTFTGSTRAVGWVAVRGPTRGKATVYVDGVLVGTVDLYASTVQPARVVYARPWATTGTHILTIRVAGTSGRPRVDLDAIASLR